jgi:3',5'-cyclic-AMP phosphodiesterase
MKRRAGLLSLIIAVCCLASCRYGLDELFSRPSPVDERVLDASPSAPSAPTVADPDNYVFIATADTHFGPTDDPPTAAAFKALVGASHASFVIIAGDLVNTGLPAEYARYAQWTASLGVPVYSTPGNHDLYNEGWATYRTVLGRGNYSFVVGGRTFYVVDTGNGTVGRAQLDLLREAFAHDTNRKVIVSHYPLYDGPDAQYYRLTDTAERAALIDLYARGNVELLLEGHQHVTRETMIGSMHEWLCSSLIGTAGNGSCVIVTVSAGTIASIVATRY